jgi:predicted dehydrogenase
VNLLSDYAAHPLGALTWRFTLESGGHGVLGDLASHGIDLIRYAIGDVDSLVAQTAVFLPKRPVLDPNAATYGHGLGDPDSPTGEVENEDYVAALVRTANGVVVTLECSRVAAGDQNRYGIEVHGTKGLVSWDFRTPGELCLSTGEEYANQPAQRLLVGPGAGDYARFQPGSGLAMSYDDTKVIELAAFVRSILSGQAAGPQLVDAVAAADGLEAIVKSAAGNSWVDLRASSAVA